MFRKIIIVTCAAVAALGMTAAASSASARDAGSFSDRLTPGQCLRWTPKTFLAQLESPSKRFTLWVSGPSMSLENEVRTPSGPYASYDTWRMDLNRRGRSASLCMQSDGNLVWRVDGTFAWASRTSGRGNTARLLDSGSLVVRNTANRTLWSSGTTAVLLRAGDRLASGRSLVNREYRSGSSRRPAIETRLQMTRGGDLVLLSKKKRVWHSNTHVRGSYLTIAANGRAVVRNAAGRTVWRSPAVGRDAVLTVASKGRITLHGRRCWVRPSHSGDCYGG